MPSQIIFRHPPCTQADAIDALLRRLLGGHTDCTDYQREPTGVFPLPAERDPLLARPDVRFIYLLVDLRELVAPLAEQFLAAGSPTIPDGYALADCVEMVLSTQIPALGRDALVFTQRENVCVLRLDALQESPAETLEKLLAQCGISHVADTLTEALADFRGDSLINPRPQGSDPLDDAGYADLFRRLSGPSQLALGYSLDGLPGAASPVARKLGFFSSSRRPYYLSAPDFRHNSAGIRVLHYLCHALNELGEEAYVTPAQSFNPALRTPPLTLETVRRHFLTGRQPIAIYPEVMAGDPLDTGLVARWLLNRPGHLGGDTRHEGSDLIFHFARWCLPDGTASDILNLPTVDTHIFNNRDNPADTQREGACYYANKFLGHGGEVSAEMRRSASSLGQEIPRAPHELADILRRTAVLYCYEQTSLIPEALACGCPVLIVPSPYWDSHGDPLVFQQPGIRSADEPDALRLASEEVRAYDCSANGIYEYYWWQVERFIDKTQKQQPPASESNTLWRLPLAQRVSALPALERHFNLLLPAGNEPAGNPKTTVTLASETEALALGNFLATQAPLPVIDLYILVSALNRQLLAHTLASLPDPLPPSVRLFAIASADAQPAADIPNLSWHESTDPAGLLNTLVASSTAPWCAICRAGDRLAPEALNYLSNQIIQNPTQLAHTSDEDAIDTDGRHTRPILHAAMDGDLLRAGRTEPGLLAVRREAWVVSGGWREDIRGLDYYDLLLRLLEICHEAGFGHIPRILVSRHRNNAALLPESPGVQGQRLFLLSAHLQRTAPGASATPGMLPTTAHVRYPLTGTPSVSILLPTSDNPERLAGFARALATHTTWAAWELIVVDNGSQPVDMAQLTALLPGQRIEYLPYPHPCNLAAMYNLAASAARGDYLLLTHDDVECLHDGWLDELLSQCQRPQVAMAGGRLLDIDGKLVGSGMIPMQAGLMPSPFTGQPAEQTETIPRPQVVHQVSALSSACMMIRRDIWQQLNGMDAKGFPRQMADIDLCLRVRQTGAKIIWTPFATLLHDTDHSTRGDRQGNQALLARWGRQLADDPCFSSAMALDSTCFDAETEAAFLPDLLPGKLQPRVYCVVSGAPARVRRQLMAPIQLANRQGSLLGRIGPVFPQPMLLARLRTDTFICPSRLDDRQRRELARLRQLTGCTLVIDLDDRLTADQLADTGEFSLDAELLALARVAQRFITTSPRLADRLSNTPLSDRLHLMPEGLNLADYPVPARRAARARPRIGWFGQADDLEMIAAAVVELAHDADWVFLGAHPDMLTPCATERHQWVIEEKMPDKLASLDLDFAIMPLRPSPANRYASLLPALQLAALGIPFMASPTLDSPDALGFFRLPDDRNTTWIDTLRNWISQPALYQQRSQALRQAIETHANIEHQIGQWQAVWSV